MRTLVLAFGVFFSLSSWAVEPLRVLNRMTWVQGADLGELQDVLNQTRDQVRKEFMGELVDAMRPFVYSGTDMAELAEILGDFLLKFDDLHEKHKADSVKRLGISLEALVMSQIDELYRENRISPAERKLTWTSGKKPAEVDAVLYGTFSLLRGGLALTLTLSELQTGRETSFVVSGPVNAVTGLMADQVFRFFQSPDYPAWVNPQPQLTWVAPANSRPMTSFADARRYCEGQSARLPFAEELVMAAQGDGVHPGSIPALESYLPRDRRVSDDRVGYAIADQQRVAGQYFYYAQADLGAQPVQPSSIFPTRSILVWCVKGAPSSVVRWTDEVYRALRVERKKQRSGEAPSRAQLALEYLLADRAAYGSWSNVLTEFDSVNEALRELAHSGYSIRLPE